MSDKKVVWDAPTFTNRPRSAGTYGSYREFLEKANKLQEEQEEAQQFLQKAMPAMVALLDYKLRNQEPLIIMRPLRYQTSEIHKGDSIDDAFYNVRRDQRPNDKFEDVVKTIMPGTQLILKSLDPALQEFIFMDGLGTEHALNFTERNNLMTQSNVFEEVRQFIEGTKE